jgi:hypothetical protein
VLVDWSLTVRFGKYTGVVLNNHCLRRNGHAAPDDARSEVIPGEKGVHNDCRTEGQDKNTAALAIERRVGVSTVPWDLGTFFNCA